jgi:hypothetical protein
VKKQVEILDQACISEDAEPEDLGVVWSGTFDDPAGTASRHVVWQPEVDDGLLNDVPGWGNRDLAYC